MSAFSGLDASPQPEQLLRYLDDTDAFMSAFKAYIVAVMTRYVPNGRVLDLGCGVGHDLTRLSKAGLRPVGVDLSHLALQRAISESSAVVQADGARLPFMDASFDGCRLERVLQHVPEPNLVIDEILRVVRPGGVVALLEPDHTSMRVDSDVDPTGSLIASQALAKHPAIGAALVGMLRDRGCLVDDVVTEHSCGYVLDGLPLKAQPALARAVAQGLVSQQHADAWLVEQTERTRTGTFRSWWKKILVVARTPGASGQVRGIPLPASSSPAAGRAQDDDLPRPSR